MLAAQLLGQARGLRIEPTELAAVGDAVVARSRWVTPAGEAGGEMHQVLRIRDGRIVDMEDCRTRREAEKLARGS